jgi:hypothetical protein
VTDVTTQELDGQIELSRQRFTQVIEQIRTVLVTDVSAHAAKACKDAFLTQSSVADSLDDGQLKAFKARGVEVGASASARLADALAGDTVWMDGPADTSDERSLEDAAGVWSHVQAVGVETRQLLDSFGFDGADVAYTPPRYFVGGLYLPTLVEHYWRLRRELGSLEGQKAAVAAETERQRLESRWNDA